jgi:hypothetical protein
MKTLVAFCLLLTLRVTAQSPAPNPAADDNRATIGIEGSISVDTSAPTPTVSGTIQPKIWNYGKLPATRVSVTYGFGRDPEVSTMDVDYRVNNWKRSAKCVQATTSFNEAGHNLPTVFPGTALGQEPFDVPDGMQTKNYLAICIAYTDTSGSIRHTNLLYHAVGKAVPASNGTSTWAIKYFRLLDSDVQ